MPTLQQLETKRERLKNELAQVICGPVPWWDGFASVAR